MNEETDKEMETPAVADGEVTTSDLPADGAQISTPE